MTRHTFPGLVDIEYGFPSPNDGRLSWRRDDAETVNYAYDSLNRLTNAATASAGGWGLGFSYDGFGNRTAQSVTKGSAPTWSQAIDPNTNRILGGGFAYDPKGNLINQPGGPSLGYNTLNQLTTVNGNLVYNYDPQGRRAWRTDPSDGRYTYFFYGVDGLLLGTFEWKTDTHYIDGIRHWFEAKQKYRYFGSRLIQQDGQRILTDRLGTVIARGTQKYSYYPYGELKSGPVTTDGNTFATYWKDAAAGGLDNAMNRWYSGPAGRFTTPDPYEASAGATAPQSWNRYVYIEGDPVNFRDPAGLATCSVSYFVNSISIACSSAGTGLSINRDIPTWFAFGGSPDPTDAPSSAVVAEYTRWMSEVADEGIPGFFLNNFDQSLRKATEALSSATCGSLFGSGSGDFANPGGVLAKMTKRPAPAYGKVTLVSGIATPEGPASGQTKGVGAPTQVPVAIRPNGEPAGGGMINLYGAASISLSLNLWANGLNDEAYSMNAQTLVHELGHLYNILVLAPGSDFEWDRENRQAAQRNQGRETGCLFTFKI